MRRVIGLFVIWLLAIAVPAQGLAAATMLHCAPQRSSTSPAAHAGHEHHGAAHAQHHHDAGAHDAIDHGQANDGSPNVKTPLQKCSACATCCVGLALPSSAQSVPEPLAEPAARPEPAVVHAAFLTSGPDRPPRT
jgi:hypothetical protein